MGIMNHVKQQANKPDVDCTKIKVFNLLSQCMKEIGKTVASLVLTMRDVGISVEKFITEGRFINETTLCCGGLYLSVIKKYLIFIIFLFIVSPLWAGTLTATLNTRAKLDPGLEFNTDNTIVRHANKPPSTTNIGERVRTYLGGTGLSDADFYPHIYRKTDSHYRVYWTRWGADNIDRFYYTDTTDTEYPKTTGTNLTGTKQLIEGGLSNEFEGARVFRKPDGSYRIYSGHSAGKTEADYWTVGYQDTTNTNPPDETNLGSFVAITGVHNTWPYPVQKPDGSWRLYYCQYAWPASFVVGSLVYQDTTDTNLPSSTNLGSVQTVFTGSGTDSIQSFWIARNLDNTYRFYFATGGNDLVRSLKYKDTSDTHLPNSSNLSTITGATSMNIGGGGWFFTSQGGELIKTDNGIWVMYYNNNTIASGRGDIFYRVSSIDTLTTDLVADPIYLVDSGSTRTVWDFSQDVLNENPLPYGGATIKYQWSVDNGTRRWNGTWLTKAQLATVANQTGRYKVIKARFTSDGTHIAALGNSTFGTKD